MLSQGYITAAAVLMSKSQTLKSSLHFHFLYEKNIEMMPMDQLNLSLRGGLLGYVVSSRSQADH